MSVIFGGVFGDLGVLHAFMYFFHFLCWFIAFDVRFLLFFDNFLMCLKLLAVFADFGCFLMLFGVADDL